MLRRFLLVLAMVTATMMGAVPAAEADPASAQCPATDGTNAGVKVAVSGTPVTASVTDTRTAELIDVVITFTDEGTRFQLSGPDPQGYVVADASWCVKAAKGNSAPLTGTGTSGASPASNKKSELLRIDNVTLFTVSVEPRAVVCLNSSTPGAPDAQPVGDFDTRGNLAVFGSTDGSCSQEHSVRETMVSAVTIEDASAKCLALGATGVDATWSATDTRSQTSCGSAPRRERIRMSEASPGAEVSRLRAGPPWASAFTSALPAGRS